MPNLKIGEKTLGDFMDDQERRDFDEVLFVLAGMMVKEREVRLLRYRLQALQAALDCASRRGSEGTTDALLSKMRSTMDRLRDLE